MSEGQDVTLVSQPHVYPTVGGKKTLAKTTEVEVGSGSVQKPKIHYSVSNEMKHTDASNLPTSFIQTSKGHPWFLWDVLQKLPPTELASKNWKNRGGPVRNQGDHENCWSYPSTDVYSSYRWINNVDSHFRVFSARYLTFYVSDIERRNAGREPTKKDHHLCHGFSTLQALEFIQNNGVPEEDPRDATSGYSCIKDPPPRVQPGLFRFPPQVEFQESNKIEDLYEMLLHHPVAANMMLFEPEYKKIRTLDVVYEGPTSESSYYEGLHSVLVLSVVKIKEKLVALVKLSHGKERGAKGYMYISLTKTIMQVKYSVEDNTISTIKKHDGEAVDEPSSILRDFTGIKRIQ